ncbi:hypothetical protein B0I35DRAFT_474566 [Stachybotrys elegans]|uniref:Uncharacterized protein n=1 Tax=Stachybotrys elegans TaxID=80388 RepID=A0A8K0WV61_9HYPO|nr:hypothetical protein B0I35DRAFT_474566 [Stachybotrys elegans]
MMSSRSAVRTALPRAARAAKPSGARQARFQSSTSSSTAPSSSHIGAGVAGGVAASVVLYGIYLTTPAGKMQRSINKGAIEASKKYDAAVKKLQEKTPEPDQAIDYIKQLAYSYVSWIPGGRQYVDAAFKDIDTLRENHREEVNEIVSDTYKKLQQLTKSGGLSLETASRAYDVIAELARRLGDLAGDAFFDILDNHPMVKEKFGGSAEQLKQLADQYGPEAKKVADETWRQVRDVLAGGFSAANMDKARQVVQESVEKLKKLGDEAWKKGLEQAKPYLDKNPKVKELIEKNADALKQGNVTELFEKAKKAVESGNVGDLEQYVNQALDKAKSKGSDISSKYGLPKYFDTIPDGSDVLSKINQLRQLAQEHKGEAENLLKETMEEVKQVLEKKAEKAQQIADKAKESK